MGQAFVDDYPGRYALSNELHARPFPELKAPCRAAYLAIKQPENAAERDHAQDRAHLLSLLDRYGAPHPAPDANHFTAPLGRGVLKWEQHTEFVTYTIFAEGIADAAFDGTLHAMFSPDWIAAAPGKVVTSCLVRVEEIEGEFGSGDTLPSRISRDIPHWFVPESLAISKVIDGAALLAGDFRIDESGHVRFAVFVRKGTSERRLGRIVQRLLEIETYKSMAMLTLPVARQTAARVAGLDRELSGIVAEMAAGQGREVETLDRLLKIAAEIELLSTGSAFRFGAAGAYEALVLQRIAVLREERVSSRQTFAEFMTRRFDPAMRTCRSARERLNELSMRAERAANLLRTRVDVASSQQNVEVLARMDDRAALQLRLQETVEGLSVVAISYYAVSLATYLFAPIGGMFGLDKTWMAAGLTLPVIISVLFLVRRIRARIAARDRSRVTD